MKKIKLLSTGGTIAKMYDELSGELSFYEKHIEEMLVQGRCNPIVEITPLMLKDSLELKSDDRKKIKTACENAPQSKIIITHGTDTMVESAKVLSTITDKTIVLTGAMVPYAFKLSDAIFNLASSISAVQTLPCGVYICMNGEVFLWDNVRKNRQKGIFEKLTYISKFA